MADGMTETPSGGSRLAWLRTVAVVFIAGIGLWYGWHWWQFRQTYEITDDSTLVSDVIPITSEVSGRIKALLVDDNEEIQAGQVLLQLDPEPFQIALQQAQADLKVAEQKAQTGKANVALAASEARAQTTTAGGGASQASAAVANAQAHVNEAEAAVQTAQAHVASAKTAQDLAQAEYDRINALAAKGYVTAQELDTARSKLDAAVSAATAAEKEVGEAQARVEQERAGVGQARAQQEQSKGQSQSAKAAGLQTSVREKEYETAAAEVEVSKAAVAEAELHLAQTTIKAPAPGRVGRKAAAPGQQIAPGQNLMALVLPNIWVTANFKETQIRRLHPQQTVVVVVDALPDVELDGVIESIAPASGATFSLLPPENATGNFTKVVQRIPVKIVLNEDDVKQYREELAPGMSVVVRVKVR